MAIDLTLLDLALEKVLVAAPTTTDADAVNAVGIAPARQPRTTLVTSATLGSVWGAATAAGLLATLQALAKAGDDAGTLANYATVVLSGPGFDPSDPQSQAVVQQFVALNLITQDMADQVIGVMVYPCGGAVTADDIKASRDRVTLQQSADILDQWLDDKTVQAKSLVSAGVTKGALPTKNDLQLVYSGG